MSFGQCFWRFMLQLLGDSTRFFCSFTKSARSSSLSGLVFPRWRPEPDLPRTCKRLSSTQVFAIRTGNLISVTVITQEPDLRRDSSTADYSINFPLSPGSSICRCTHNGALPFDSNRS